jgi:hypothetical protein
MGRDALTAPDGLDAIVGVVSPLWDAQEMGVTTRGPSIALPRLRSLHASMRKEGIDRAAFSYVNNRARLEVVFITDEVPYVLLIAARGVGRTAFEVPVEPGYRVGLFLDREDYKRLLDVLGVRPNRENPFSTKAFFLDLDQHVPASAHGREAPPHVMALRGHDVEEQEKVYFLSWLPNRGGRHVTAANLAKTHEFLGRAAFERCRRGNISSRWTARMDEASECTLGPE